MTKELDITTLESSLIDISGAATALLAMARYPDANCDEGLVYIAHRIGEHVAQAREAVHLYDGIQPASVIKT